MADSIVMFLNQFKFIEIINNLHFFSYKKNKRFFSFVNVVFIITCLRSNTITVNIKDPHMNLNFNI